MPRACSQCASRAWPPWRAKEVSTLSSLNWGEPSMLVVRDKALLLVGFAGAFRRVDLTRRRWRDMTETSEGLIVHLGTSKTDVDGRGRDVGIPFGRSDLTCPVKALRAWRQRCPASARHQVDRRPAGVRGGRPLRSSRQ